jgi:hypothetical protein
MPILSVFICCEKVVIDKNESASLICLFTDVKGEIPPEAPELPPNAAAPKEWAAFTMWNWEHADVGEYIQWFEVLYPDGTPFLERRQVRVVKEENKPRSQVTINVQGIPVGRNGRYTVRVWLERDGIIVVQPHSVYLNVEFTRGVAVQ